MPPTCKPLLLLAFAVTAGIIMPWKMWSSVRQIYVFELPMKQKMCLESPPRLGSDVIRMLHWTTSYGKNVEMNSSFKCGDKVCHLTSEKSLIDSSHAVLFKGWREDLQAVTVVENGTTRYEAIWIPTPRYRDQYWVLLMLEPPRQFTISAHMQAYNSLFNWTMSYRTDADVYLPYGRFLPNENIDPILITEEEFLPETKTKLVAQIISNCKNVSSQRAPLVQALQKHIPVDIYGECGPLKCPPNFTGSKCKDFIGQFYKFYLAFENALCQDYITEKFYHALAAGMVPVVYGGANYGIFAPRGSYINVNSFPSAKALAQYLLYLDRNDDEYLKFFEWRREFQIPKAVDYMEGYCNLCRKLHEDYPRKRESVYSNITDWLYTRDGRYSVCSRPIYWE